MNRIEARDNSSRDLNRCKPTVKAGVWSLVHNLREMPTNISLIEIYRINLEINSNSQNKNPGCPKCWQGLD